MMSCDYYRSTREDASDWVSLSIDAAEAAPFLEAMLTISSDVMKSAFDARDTEMAEKHFDFSINLINTIHRIHNEQKGGDE